MDDVAIEAPSEAPEAPARLRVNGRVVPQALLGVLATYGGVAGLTLGGSALFGCSPLGGCDTPFGERVGLPLSVSLGVLGAGPLAATAVVHGLAPGPLCTRRGFFRTWAGALVADAVPVSVLLVGAAARSESEALLGVGVVGVLVAPTIGAITASWTGAPDPLRLQLAVAPDGRTIAVGARF